MKILHLVSKQVCEGKCIKEGFNKSKHACVEVAEISNITQKMTFSITDFFRKCDQMRSFPRIWSHLLKKSATENFIFCAVNCVNICLKI